MHPFHSQSLKSIPCQMFIDEYKEVFHVLELLQILQEIFPPTPTSWKKETTFLISLQQLYFALCPIVGCIKVPWIAAPLISSEYYLDKVSFATHFSCLALSPQHWQN